jgi:ELWxxDGT repeat protein
LPSGKLVFKGYNSTYGYEPWVSDGTEAGTLPIDLYSNSGGKSGSSSPYSFIEFQGEVVFSAYVYGWVKGSETISVGQELVFTNGTVAGTHVLDVYPGMNSSNPGIIGEANGLLYFTATTANGNGIYSTNGTTFTKLATVNDSATRLAWNANKAFFSVSDTTNGAELWVADFTANTFTLVKDILAGSGSGLSGDVGAVMVGDKLVFKAYTSATQQNLFVSNGTSAGTVQIGSSLGAYAALGDVLVFADGNSISAANVSGSTPVKVELVNASSAVLKMQSDSDQAFFSLANGDLYSSSGTLITTKKLASSVKNFKVVADNALYLVVANSQSTTGYDLWYSDGTISGTRYIEDVPSDFYPQLDSAVAILTVGVNV